jgi:hypothetical protein
MPWHTFRLSSAQEDAGAGGLALDQFSEWLLKMGDPPGMAMFCIQRPGENFATYYLSPETQQRAPVLVRLLRAKPGEPPPPDATLMAGANGSRPSDFA